MAGFWRHIGDWAWDFSLPNTDTPAGPGAHDATPWFGNSLLWDNVTGNADPGVFAPDPQLLVGLTPWFDIALAPAGVPSPLFPAVMPSPIITVGDDLPVNEVTPPGPNEPSPPGLPPLPPVTPATTPPPDLTHWFINQIPSLTPDPSLFPPTSPLQLTGVPTATDATLLGIPNH